MNKILINRNKFLFIVFILLNYQAYSQVDSSEIRNYQNLIKNPCMNFDEAQYDEFSHTKNMHTPMMKPTDPENRYLRSVFYDVVFFKTISKKSTKYSVLLSTTTPTAAAREHGVIIILNNGKRINKPTVIVDTEVNQQAEFERKSIFDLTISDIELLKKSKIKSFQLYDAQNYEQESETLYKTFICLLNKTN